MRSMHSSEKKSKNWSLNSRVTDGTDPAELWETQHKHIFMGAGKYDNKHGVGIMLNKRWRKNY